jgi:hypothetical protein
METSLRGLGPRTLLAAVLSLFGTPGLADPGNSVVILNDGYVREIPGRTTIPWQDDDGGRIVASTVALVRGPGVILIADPGMVHDFPGMLKQLEDLGISTGDVTHVFISHHHPDHAYHAGVFEHAKLIDFAGIYQNDVWYDHADNYEIAPGIRVLKTPGHTHEDASLVVDTPDGTYALTHAWWYDMQPEKSPLAQDHDQLDASRLKLLEIADWIVPGHGAPFENPNRTGKPGPSAAPAAGAAKTEVTPKGLTLTSNSFKDGDYLDNMYHLSEPYGFGCNGDNLSPHFAWSGVPDGTESFVMTVFHPDAPTGSGFWHWVVVNIPAGVRELAMGAGALDSGKMPAGSLQVRTDIAKPGYIGPCLPKGVRGVHRYFFTLHAVNVKEMPVTADSAPALVGFYLNRHSIAKSTLTALHRK